ncbi:hypothetical protein GCM10028862_19240 [Luteimonas pelagia]
MDTIRILAAAGLLAAAPAAVANGLLASPASHIVGTWSNVALVGPCGGTPGDAQRQTLVFNSGGTFLDNARMPPQGLPNLLGIAGTHQRSIGIGTWSYNATNREYTVVQRFDWYVDNAYHGYQVVERTLQLSANRRTAAGPVRTARYNAAGQKLLELCGVAESTRL